MIRFVLIISFAGLCLPVSANLDSEGLPFDYIRPAKGGKYIFVMLRPARQRQYAYDYQVYPDASSFKSTSKDGLLFKKYPASGLYRNDGSTNPLWTVDWFSFDVRPCSDGVHLVRFGPWVRSADGGKTLAVAFYRSGVKIRSFAVRDLIRNFEELPHSISHYQWKKSDSFDDVGKRLRIEIFRGYNYASGGSIFFDITTGLRR